jgi:hypothetical protein
MSHSDVVMEELHVFGTIQERCVGHSNRLAGTQGFRDATFTLIVLEHGRIFAGGYSVLLEVAHADRHRIAYSLV